jgi:hypothetical protein
VAEDKDKKTKGVDIYKDYKEIVKTVLAVAVSLLKLNASTNQF